ncbi:MAG: EAL domain-containing protein [Rhodospirillales bacterium]|nr:EAL domain-containing protein [Rhodospirillales bacterium]
MWGRLRPANTALALLVLAIAVESAAHFLQAMAPVVLDTSPWIIGIGGYILTLALIELDLRQLLANFAQNRFQSIALALGDGVICLDAEGRVTFWNPGARAIFGYTAAEIIGRPFSDLHDNRVDPDLCGFLSRCDASQQVTEIVGVRNNRDKFPLELRISSWLEGDVKHFGAIVRDISARKRDEERIRHLALHDALTGLANRAQIRDRLEQCIDGAKQRHETVALLLVDLDNFKEINDTLGHEAGDRFLCSFADQLRACVGVDTAIARLGGDEFVVVVEGPGAEARSKSIVRSIADIFGDRHSYIDGNGFLISASIGSAMYPRDADNIDDLMANADLALYRAKKRRHGAHVSYDSAFKRDLEHRRQVEAELARAVAEDEFELFYQPQISLRDGHVVGAEALIRWRHPTRGLVPPDEFLEVLHACKLSNLVGSWVLRAACEQGRRWQSEGRDLRVGVNLSPSQFHADLPMTIERVLSQTGLAPDRLEIEVTEQILLKEDARTVDLLGQIRRLGVRIAFDDFGTGYASLSHLKRFPLDCLKIDRSFVRDLGIDRNNTAITTAIIELGNRLGLCTIAEGIEDEQSAEWLAKLGCSEGQGYYFGKPMPVAQMQEMLEAQGRVSASAA